MLFGVGPVRCIKAGGTPCRQKAVAEWAEAKECDQALVTSSWRSAMSRGSLDSSSFWLLLHQVAARVGGHRVMAQALVLASVLHTFTHESRMLISPLTTYCPAGQILGSKPDFA